MKNTQLDHRIRLPCNGLFLFLILLASLALISSCNPPAANVEEIVENLQISYEANGATSGSPPVDEQLYLPGDEIEIKENSGSLTKDGYSFEGWNTAQEGNGTSYNPGDTITIGESDIKLFAEWALLPQISDQNQESQGLTLSAVELIDPASLGLRLKGQKWLLEPSETMKVTADTAIIVESFQWYLDGEKRGTNHDEFTVDANALSPGQHTVAVIVKKEETYSSASYIFNVAQSIASMGFEDGFLPSGANSYNFSALNTYISNPSEEELWRVVSSEFHEGGKSLRAGTINDGESSYLRIPIEIPEGQILAKVSFWYKVSTEKGFDFLRFSTLIETDSDTYIWNRLAQFSGENNWSEYSTFLKYSWLDSLSIVFIYAKSDFFADGQDTAWVDDIRIAYIAE